MSFVFMSVHRYTYPLQNDVSIWMKNSRVGRKSETNKNCKMGNAEIRIKLNFFFRILALNLIESNKGPDLHALVCIDIIFYFSF